MSGAANGEFQEDPAPGHRDGSVFVVDIEGYEGPLDVLLTLARDHKLDVTQISILTLADQYLAFIAEIRRQHLEVAADYLVMAAWLAYLKSRLLLPGPDDGGGEPTGEEMAAALAFQIQRLEAIREAGRKIMEMPRLGVDRMARGEPEDFPANVTTALDVTLHDLLQAYAACQRRSKGDDTLHVESFGVYTVDDALARLRRLLGGTPGWAELWSYLPDNLKADPLLRRSAVASTFAASLELAREGRVKIRQADTFGAIFVAADSRAGNKRRDNERNDSDK